MRYCHLSGVECVVAGRGREPGLWSPHVDAGQQPVLADHLEVLTQGGGGARGRGSKPHVRPSQSDAPEHELIQLCLAHTSKYLETLQNSLGLVCKS